MTETYRPTARFLHWTVAAIVLCMIPAGLIMTTEGLPRPVQDTLFIFHKNAGVIVGLLMLVRLAYRGAHPPPPLPASVPDWQARIARLTHGLLYALLILMAVSGFVRVTAGGFPLEGWDALGLPRLPKMEAVGKAASSLHWATAMVLIPLVLLHAGAALHHALVRRDGVFARMWPAAGR
ncbi:cytochrome b [Cereibacter sphaeroides]|uniref:cytochrome b n=1 Tax=Cereibacter sphaeroides TaxID=1063 RepID=UPI001F1F082C|nr:cytochrome b [Cereibacter sphaeroides]MCE6958014.1 cytochrome b [Cereibacter sphaeroides]MCE6971949.1 cytochrome b [Cereibacter sphaeroides]